MLGSLAGDEIGQPKCDLVPGANDADGVTAANDGNPVGHHADAGRPAERLAETVRRPDKQEEVKAGTEAKEDIERGGAEHADSEHDAGRDTFSHLAIKELADAVGDF